jgi:hypothetical protein
MTLYEFALAGLVFILYGRKSLSITPLGQSEALGKNSIVEVTEPNDKSTNN